MAFKATNPLLAEAYKQIKGTMFQLKSYAMARSTIFATGATESEILTTVDNLASMLNILQINASVPGLADYAKIQENDPTYDVVAEYIIVVSAVNAVLDYISANIPAPRTFTDIQLDPLKVTLDALVLTID